MAGTKKKVGPGEAVKKEPEAGVDKKTMKRMYYGSNLILIGVAFIILIIMFFVASDFIDKTEKLVVKSADDACDTLTAIEATLVDVGDEMLLLEGTMSGINESFHPLADGLGDMGDAIDGVADSLSALEILGIHIGDDLGNTADDLRDTSDSLRSTADSLDAQTGKFSEISDDINAIAMGVSAQKRTMCDKTDINEIFDSLRNTVLILMLLAAALLFIPFINSAAGMI